MEESARATLLMTNRWRWTERWALCLSGAGVIAAGCATVLGVEDVGFGTIPSEGGADAARDVGEASASDGGIHDAAGDEDGRREEDATGLVDVPGDESAAPVEAGPDAVAEASEGGCSSRVFVTSATYSAGLGGVAQGDGLCQLVAGYSSLTSGPRSWRAWLSDDSTSAENRLTHSTCPYVLVDGTLIANDWNDLTTSGTLRDDGGIFETEDGGAVTGITGVWTGTDSNGAVVPSSTCASWNPAANGLGAFGICYRTDPGWSNVGSTPCSQPFHLYCFEQ